MISHNLTISDKFGKTLQISLQKGENPGERFCGITINDQTATCSIMPDQKSLKEMVAFFRTIEGLIYEF